MRIAFVSGNREQLPDAVTPLGLLSVMASTPAHHERVLIDLCFEENAEESLRSALTEFEPDLVALGMRNIQNSDYSGLSDNIGYYQTLIRVARQAAEGPIIVGGSGFSVMPEQLMARLRPNFGISGEGEGAFPKLVTALERGGVGLEEVGSLHRWTGEGVFSNPPAPAFLDLNTLPFPNRGLADPRYYEEFGIESVQTKRGCPLLCDYCTYPKIEGRIGRTRDPSAVVNEMFQSLDEHPGIRHFFIVDSVFNLPTKHAKRVCQALIDSHWEIPWTCYSNPLGFDREYAELAHRAGCAGMEIGSDSGCDEVLKRLKKGFTTDHIRRLHAICEASGVPDCHTFILGTEGETLDDVRRTLDFIVDLDPFCAVIMIWVDDYEALDPKLRAQRTKLREQIGGLLVESKDEYPHWSVPPLGINFDEDLFRRLRRAEMHGPAWQHMRRLARPGVA